MKGFLNDSLDLKIQLAKELENTVRLQKLNQELYEHLVGTICWLLKYAEKHDITPPNLDRIHDSIQRIHLLMDHANELIPFSPPTQNQHDFKHEDDSTEPKIIIY